MTSQEIGGYIYYDNKIDAARTIKTTDDVLAHEAGLGWYIHSRKEYNLNPRKRMFGF